MAPWHDCEQFHSQPDGAPSAADPPSGPLNVPANSRHVSPRGAPLACPLPNSARLATAGRHHRACAAASRRPHHHLLESGLARSPSPTHQPLCQRQRQSLRWIRAKAEKGDYDGAIADYDRAIATAPDAVEAYVNRAISRDNEGDYEGAIADWTRALELNPGDAGWYVNRGMVRETIGDYDGALAEYSRSTELEPDYEVAYIARAYIRGKQGDYEVAITKVRSLIWTVPLNWTPTTRQPTPTGAWLRGFRMKLDDGL